MSDFLVIFVEYNIRLGKINIEKPEGLSIESALAFRYIIRY